MKLFFKKLDERAQLPVKAIGHEADFCFDCFAVSEEQGVPNLSGTYRTSGVRGGLRIAQYRKGQQWIWFYWLMMITYLMINNMNNINYE